MPSRPIDGAMLAERRDKQAIRKMWVEAVARAAEEVADSDRPLYLTLPGAHGLDIRALIDAGLIETTAVGGIAQKDQWKVVAVENNSLAVAALQEKMPGLRIRQANALDVLRGLGPRRWPEGDDLRYCRALVINLDFNGPLAVSADEGAVVFPLFVQVDKLATIQAEAPRTGWTLCLTLNADWVAGPESAEVVVALLRENCEFDATFAAAFGAEFDDDLRESLFERGFRALEELPFEVRQRVLLAFVPKRIVRIANARGWRMVAERSLRYGGDAGSAAMVTMIMSFIWDPRCQSQPDTVYREGIRTLFDGWGRITTEGELEDA